jgi:hypothetical protein
MNQLTPADAATLGLSETELAHLCDQDQATEFYPAPSRQEAEDTAATAWAAYVEARDAQWGTAAARYANFQAAAAVAAQAARAERQAKRQARPRQDYRISKRRATR